MNATPSSEYNQLLEKLVLTGGAAIINLLLWCYSRTQAEFKAESLPTVIHLQDASLTPSTHITYAINTHHLDLNSENVSNKAKICSKLFF